MRKVTTILGVLILSTLSVFAQRALDARDNTVQLSAEVKQGTKAAITIKWAENDSHTGEITIRRKDADTHKFPSKTLAVLKPGTKEFTDKDIEIGKRYSYSVMIHGTAIIQKEEREHYAFGYIEAGVEAEEIHNLGKVLLLVDETIAKYISDEIDRLIEDMTAEGWSVVKRLAPRAEKFDRAKVDKVKAIIKNEYIKDKNLNTVFLLGRIPVAYAGESNPDGHKNHKGAWASDMYYGDIHNNVWTDKIVNDTTASSKRNHNVPKDGKFDNDGLMLKTGLQATEIAVGRVDLYNMPIFHKKEWGDKGEIELLRQYLDKDHAWRTGKWRDIPRTAIIGNNFKSMLEGFASSGWRNFSSIVGAEQIKEVGHSKWIPELDSNKHLFAYGAGGGSYESCSGIGKTKDFDTNNIQAPFIYLFGSYFGDWDVKNNILRAPLASMPYGLTCCWDGRPHWFFHELVMGKSFGHCVLTSQNNAYISGNSYRYIHLPNILEVNYNGKLQSVIYAIGFCGRHMSFLGDPTLRLDSYQGISVTDLKAEQVENTIELKWTGPTTDNIYHFNIYKRYDSEDSWEKVNQEPIKSESFIDINPKEPGDITYQVRVATLTSCNTGTYYQVGRSPMVDVYFEPLEAVDDFESLYSASVSPNPASDMCEIFVSVSEYSNCNIEIFDVSGKKIRSFEEYIMNEKRFVWDMKDEFGKDIPSGTYLIQINNDRASNVLKLIKK